MLKIFKILSLTSCVLFLSACSSNYLMTFNGENLTKDEDKGNFSFNNDTVQLDYSFAGSDGKVYLRIANKIDKPILWDLKSSAMVINGKAYSYAAESAAIEGQLDGSVTSLGNRKTDTFMEDRIQGYFNGSISLPKDMILIPPHAYIDGSYFDFRNDIKEVIKSAEKEKVYMYDVNGESYGVNLARFEPEDSPYHLRSFLSYSILVDDNVLLKNTEQKFYVAQLWQTGAIALNKIVEMYHKRGDVIAYKEKKGQNIWVVGGAAALTAAAVAIDNKNPE
ncbi:hypothetical protein HX021_18260 [Sphingobacterium sp. N143]|uniref:hypothetical protein n=1 Tax=Sphingobacterium sp. N143 TaxID=2746727 RepID=UPI00257689BD|nr:hypothetical protein [Sphingobacterium sp. N143]MDM1296232.1 hypothetical protein [Sphingobacterium sp. N143]